MKPERALEIANDARERFSSMGENEVLIKAILQACAEQREADAKICDVVGDNAVGDHEPGGAYACASAIRKEQA